MNIDDSLINTALLSREIQYGLAVGAVAVFVVLLLRRRPTAGTLTVYLLGALVGLFATPLLETAVSILDRAIGTGSSELITIRFWRVLALGLAGAAVGIALMARGWRDSPER